MRFHRSTAGSVLVVIALSCQSARPPAGDDGAPGDDTASIPFTGETLVFPPAPTRRDRRPLPPHLAGVDDDAKQPIAIESPELDAAGHFEFAGQTVRLRFTRPVKRDDKSAPPLRITPEIAGKATWQSDWSIAFTAEQPFDPDKTYAIEVGPLGPIVTVDETKATSLPGVFAAGDITRMGHTVTFACADGVMAALAIHRSLMFGTPT